MGLTVRFNTSEIPLEFAEIFAKMNVNKLIVYNSFSEKPLPSSFCSIFGNTKIQNLTITNLDFTEGKKPIIGSHLKSLSILEADPDSIAEVLQGNTSLQKLSTKFIRNSVQSHEKFFDTVLSLRSLSEIFFQSVQQYQIPHLAELIASTTASVVNIHGIELCDGDALITSLQKSTSVTTLTTEKLKFTKKSGELWRILFSQNTTLANLSVYESDFTEKSFDVFCDSLLLAKSLTKISLMNVSNQLEQCISENSIKSLCNLIKKNVIHVFSFSFNNQITPKISNDILLAIKESNSIKELYLTFHVIHDDALIFCEILDKNILTNLSIGYVSGNYNITSDVANMIKKHIQTNNTLEAISFGGVDVPSNFLWDLLPRNTLRSMFVSGRVGTQLSDFEHLFWNFSLTNAYINEFGTHTANILKFHCDANRGTNFSKFHFFFSYQ